MDECKPLTAGNQPLSGASLEAIAVIDGGGCYERATLRPWLTKELRRVEREDEEDEHRTSVGSGHGGGGGVSHGSGGSGHSGTGWGGA